MARDFMGKSVRSKWIQTVIAFAVVALLFSIAGFSLLTEDPSGMSRGPYLQSVTPTGIVVR